MNNKMFLVVTAIIGQLMLVVMLLFSTQFIRGDHGVARRNLADTAPAPIPVRTASGLREAEHLVSAGDVPKPSPTSTALPASVTQAAVALDLQSGSLPMGAERVIQLSTINWEPFAGEALLNDGFFSHIVTESFSRVGYRVEFKYRPWTRALQEAIDGDVHGVMVAYWTQDRAEVLDYPDVVWKVKEEFITLQDSPIVYAGDVADLKPYRIGVLRGGAQGEALEAAGLQTDAVGKDAQNVLKLLANRVDAVLLPRDLFFYLLEQEVPQYDRSGIKILAPPFEVFDMFVAFSKKKPDHAQLTADFNRGLALIKSDDTFEQILRKHNVVYEE